MQNHEDSQRTKNKTREQYLKETWDLERAFLGIDLILAGTEEITLEMFIKKEHYLTVLNSINSFIEILEVHFFDNSLDEISLSIIIDKLELLRQKKAIVQEYVELYLTE